MGIGTQASGALVLATAPPKSKTRGRSEAEREARVWYGTTARGEWRDSAKWCLGYFYHFKAEMGLLPF